MSEPYAGLIPTTVGGTMMDTESVANSALGEELLYVTVPVSWTSYKFRTFNDRTYHHEEENIDHWGPNDEPQSKAWALFHLALTSLYNGDHHMAPVEGCQNVLDIGTGEGNWAIDFADHNPQATVTGTDITPIQPTYVPPNVQFELEDFTEPWTYHTESMDFVHMRCLMGTTTNWNELFREAYAVVRPGGFIESMEVSPRIYAMEDDLPPNSAIAQWGRIFEAAGQRLRRSFRILEEDVQIRGLAAAGFQDLHCSNICCPLGTWPQDALNKEAGGLFLASWLEDIQGFIQKLCTTLGWTLQEIDNYTLRLRRELAMNNRRLYFRARNVYARKPLVGGWR